MDARASPGTGRKRKGGAGNRGRKRCKRLDAIRDRSPPSADSPEVRRSSRVRKAPVLLDSSPGPSGRKSSKRRRGIGVGGRSKKAIERDGRQAGHSAKRGIRFVEDGSGEWGSRLRSRSGKRMDYAHVVSPDGNSNSLSKRDYVEPEEDSQQTEVAADLPVDETDGWVTLSPQSVKGKKRGRKPKKRKKKQKKGQLSKEVVETGNAPCSLNGEQGGDAGRNQIEELGRDEKDGETEEPEKEQECHNASPKDSVVVALERKEVNITLVGKENDCDEEAFTKQCSLEGNTQHEGNRDVFEKIGYDDQYREQNDVLENADHKEQDQRVQMCIDGNADSPRCSSGEQDLQYSLKLNDNCSQNDKNSAVCIPEVTVRGRDVGLGEHNLNSATASDIHNPIKLEASERRRCGLCGRRSDGKPPKRLVHDSAGSENEAYNGSSASDEPNYDALDGFGDDPEWLGRLLGPIRDHFGITRIWVHQHCAVWSPEVYFAGLGCLKNVRAALCRGRALKCCRCGRPGATIGCRVDRCPKTYHLPCARSAGCIFDHRKFLIACQDHRHHFQPQGYLYFHHVKRMKAKKLKLDMKKQSNEASRKDLEAEERWLENCGEDEEFLKRERRRLHRDVLRIAPTYIGGSSENNDLFQGWEAVAGLKGVIQCMKEVVILPLLYPEVFNSLSLTPPRGILLHGYPGTGKTMVVRSLIGECSRGNKRIAYFARKGADCLGKYVGDAERQLRLLFQAAERFQPSIIFFDEIDGLAPCRSRRQDQTHNSVVSTLLSLMDGLKSRGSVIVIGATNRPDSVDPALRRPGRFDREIYFPLPSFEDRSAILSLHTKNWPKPLSEPVLSWIAKETVGYAGADLHALCTQAAMIALKRNCPLQELLSSAEKGLRSDNHPSLPCFAVQEGDWLAALECSPPPCSRREAGIAANCVTSSPLQSHLLPCLLHPLSQLLISLYLNECIWLPPVLLRASKLIRNFIFSRMEQVNLPHASWMTCLPSLLHESEVAENIERILLHTGLLVGPSFSTNMPNGITSYECSQSDSNQINTGSLPFSNGKQKAFGFRLLITGSQRSCQQHLAMSIIHGFMGDVEIQKINLATISQEGNGDIILGVTRILLKSLGLGRCILYLPRINLWAENEVQTTESNEDSCVETSNSGKHLEFDAKKKSSAAWDSFTEQVDSASASSLIIVATSEVQIHDLPIRVRQFFTGSQFKTQFSVFPQYTVPRLHVQLDGKFDSKLLINLYSAKLSQDLSKQFVLKIHQKCHCASVPGADKSSELSEENCQGQSQNPKSIEATGAVHPESLVLNNAVSIGERDCGMRQSASPRLRANKEVYIQGHDHDSPTLHFPPNKVLKGNSMISISSFGYQILRFPHFAELCWVTSRLKEGPSVDLTGSWKVWPFNSCIMRPTGSPSKTCKDNKNLGVVRGLVAVGLQAYRGGYTCVKDVSFEVRKVLDILVAEINTKILGGKDRYRFLRILSQVAYLDDLVRNWAYAFSSLQMESPALECDTTHADEKQFTNGQGDKNKRPDDDDYSPNVEKNDSDENLVSEKPCSPKLPSENGDSFNQSCSLAPEMDPSKTIVSPAPVSPSLNSNFSCKATSPEKSSMMEVLASSQIRSEAGEESNPLHMTKSFIDSSVPNEDGGSSDRHATDRVIVGSANGNTTPPDKVLMTTDSTLENIINNAVTLDTSSCLYECCSQCLHVAHVWTRKFLTDSCESKGCYSTVEDIHDALGSCSARLVAATSGCYSSQSHNKFEAHSKKHRRQVEKCSCQNVEVVMHDKVGFGSHHSNDTMITAEECSCHQNAVQLNATGDICQLCQHPLRFFFKNGTLVPCDPSMDAKFHCNYSKLCLCPMLDGMLTCEQPPS